MGFAPCVPPEHPTLIKARMKIMDKSEKYLMIL